MELRTNSPISYPINLQFKHQPRRLNPHIQREIQVIKFHPLRRRQPGEQISRNRVQIRSEGTDIDEFLFEGVGRCVGVACYEVVFYDEGLTWSEVSRVVEGYGLGLRDLRSLREWVSDTFW